MSEENKTSRTGKFSWNELMTTDVESAKAFYAKLFGWTAETMPMPNGSDYYFFKKDGEPAAGMMGITEEMGPIPPHWMSYVEVADLDASVAAATAGGGAILNGPIQVSDMGILAVVKDPQGAVFSFWQNIVPSED